FLSLLPLREMTMDEMTMGNVTLRKPDPADNHIIAELANNKRVWDNLTDIMPHPYSVADANTFINMAVTSEIHKIFAIEYRNNLAGIIGLHGQTGVFRLTAEIGYWIGEPYWNRGIATRAVRLLTHYGIKHLDLVRIYASVYDFNKTSQRVLEKAGYRFEGVAKKAIIKNGVILDDYRYSFLDDYMTDNYLMPEDS
ncbi:MAG: GNAT family N-acetyltransferase, partial [Bacteroidales bacterium]|nr:GNAT family N-acetyltransferase [Bacteroidales bacterium]